jgi:hypothetical protein
VKINELEEKIKDKNNEITVKEAEIKLIDQDKSSSQKARLPNLRKDRE